LAALLILNYLRNRYPFPKHLSTSKRIKTVSKPLVIAL
jgi:hypothetical protein